MEKGKGKMDFWTLYQMSRGIRAAEERQKRLYERAAEMEDKIDALRAEIRPHIIRAMGNGPERFVIFDGAVYRISRTHLVQPKQAVSGEYIDNLLARTGEE